MKKTIIIIHEIYGITENLLKLKRTLTDMGYCAVLPALYDDNYSGSEEKECYNRFYSQVGIEKGYRIIDSIIAENYGSEIYLIGFSAGATIAWLHSTNRSIRTVIGIYGSKIRDYPDINPEVDTFLFFCNETAFDIYSLIDRLKVKERVKISIISGKHGFYNSSDTPDKISARLLNEQIFRIISL